MSEYAMWVDWSDESSFDRWENVGQQVMREFCKPLSAKADSFSLPSSNEGGREVRVVYETPTTNVSRSDSISG